MLFLKLCRPVVSLDFPPRDLVSGMYLPIAYYNLLVESGRGSRCTARHGAQLRERRSLRQQ